LRRPPNPCHPSVVRSEGYTCATAHSLNLTELSHLAQFMRSALFAAWNTWVEAHELSRKLAWLCRRMLNLQLHAAFDRWVHTASRTPSDGPFPHALESRTSKPDPRRQQDWLLKSLRGSRAHPLAACGVATLCRSPPGNPNSNPDPSLPHLLLELILHPLFNFISND
jgi:hypothetical protein